MYGLDKTRIEDSPSGTKTVIIRESTVKSEMEMAGGETPPRDRVWEKPGKAGDAERFSFGPKGRVDPRSPADPRIASKGKCIGGKSVRRPGK